MIAWKGGRQDRNGRRKGVIPRFDAAVHYLHYGTYRVPKSFAHSEHPNRVAWTAIRNLPTDDPWEAVTLMEATAHQNSRVEKPGYHMGASLPHDESLSREQWEEVADAMLASLGLSEHQTVIALHEDRDHQHVHVIVNRVGMDGSAWKPSFDEKKLTRAMREMERHLDLQRVPTRSTLTHDPDMPPAGPPAVEWDEKLAAARIRRVLFERLSKAATWDEIEDIFASHGLRLLPADRGAGAFVLEGEHRINLSRIDRTLSGVQLGRRFGESLRAYFERQPDRPPLAPTRLQIELEDASLEAERIVAHLAAHRATWSEQDIQIAAAHRPDNEWVVESALAHERVQRIALGPEDEVRYTAKPYLRSETLLFEVAARLAKRQTHALDKADTEDDGGPVTSDQQAITTATAGPDLTLVSGPPGSGKTRMVVALAERYRSEGREVIGVAPSARGALDLVRSGVRAYSAAAIRRRIEAGSKPLPEGGIVVVDDAEQCDTHHLASLLLAVEEAGGKALLVGDGKGLQPIGPGAAFRGLAERSMQAQLETSHRSIASEGRSPVDAVRWSETPQQTAEALAEHLLTALGERANETVLALTATRAEADALNATIHRMLRDLHPPEAAVAVGTIEVLPGERVMFLRTDRTGEKVEAVEDEPDRDVLVATGDLGTVESIEDGRLIVRLDRGGTVRIDPARYDHLDHGYALDVRRAAGREVDHSLVFASDRFDRHAARVAFSRHVRSIELFADRDTFPADADLERVIERARGKDLILDHGHPAFGDTVPEEVLDRARALTAHHARWNLAEILAGVPNDALSPDDLPALGIIPLPRGMATRASYLRDELAIVQHAAQLARRPGFVDDRAYARDLAASDLSAEQQKALRAALGQRLTLITGRAGSGKTRMLRAFAEIHAHEGNRVLGAALAGKAADGLGSAAGIESRTLAAWIARWQRDELRLVSGDVLVVDEASMVDVPTMARVIEEVSQTDASLVVVGDPNQLAPIGPGDAFRLLLDRYPATSLETIHRQRVPWQIEASIDAASGRMVKALHAYHERDAIAFLDDDNAAIEHLVRLYLDDNESQLERAAILAFHRFHVEALNRAVHDARRRSGAVSGSIRFRDREFSIGDRIILGANDYGKRVRLLEGKGDIRNGNLGTLEATRDALLHIRLDDGRLIEIDPQVYSHFDHGYATTVHKAQGITVDRAYFLAYSTKKRGIDRAVAYVALTRHRDDLRIAVSKANLPDIDAFAEALSKGNGKALVLDTIDEAGAKSLLEASLVARARHEQSRPALRRLGIKALERAATSAHEDRALLRRAFEREKSMVRMLARLDASASSEAASARRENRYLRDQIEEVRGVRQALGTEHRLDRQLKVFLDALPQDAIERLGLHRTVQPPAHDAPHAEATALAMADARSFADQLVGDLRDRSPTWTDRDVRILARYRHDLDLVTEAVAHHPDALRVAIDRDGEVRYTSRQYLAQEIVAFDLAEQLEHRHLCQMSAEAARATVASDGKPWTDQHQATFMAAAGPDLALIHGAPGSGKTAVLGTIAELHRQAGHEVVGLAPTAQSARHLGLTANVPSRSVHAWRHDEAARGLTPGTVVLVDDAERLSIREMADVLGAVHRAGGKAVLAGDALGIQPIAAGAAFRGLADEHDAIRLEAVHRQRDLEEREWIESLDRLPTSEVVAMLAERDGLAWEPDRSSAIARLARDLVDGLDEHPGATALAITPTRAESDAVNRAAHALRRERDPDADTVALRGRDFGAGDRVRFTQYGRFEKRVADEEGTVAQGTFGTAQDIDNRPEMVSVARDTFGTVQATQDGHLLVDLDDGPRVAVDPERFDHLDHGYALNVHQAAGREVDRAHVLMTERLDRHAARVALSRHRESVRVTADRETFPSDLEVALKMSHEQPNDLVADHGRVSFGDTDIEEARDAVRALAEHKAILTRRDLRDLTGDDHVLDHLDRVDDVIEVDEGRFATRQQLEREIALVDTADRIAGRSLEPVAPDLLDQVSTEHDLSEDKRQALDHALSHRLAIVTGRAGAGKTRLARAIAVSHQLEGRRVRGAALTSQAAKVLAEKAGVEAQPVAVWTQQWDRAEKLLGRNDVLLVDEAGMLDVEAMERLLREVDRARAHVVVIGDPYQLPPIGAGDALRAVLDRHDSVSLDGIYRQREPWQIEASRDASRGHLDAAIRAYAEGDRVHVAPSLGSIREELVARFLAHRDDGRNAAILADRRVDVQALNSAVHEARRERGDLVGGRTIRGREFSVGDRIAFGANDLRQEYVQVVDTPGHGPGEGVRNGVLGEITHLGDQEIQVHLDDGRVVRFDPLAYQRFDLGYATTVAKAQGQTVDRTFYLARRGASRQSAYVALTRHRESLDIFAARSDFRDIDDLAASLGKRTTSLALDSLTEDQARQVLDVASLPTFRVDKTERVVRRSTLLDVRLRLPALEAAFERLRTVTRVERIEAKIDRRIAKLTKEIQTSAERVPRTILHDGIDRLYRNPHAARKRLALLLQNRGTEAAIAEIARAPRSLGKLRRSLSRNIAGEAWDLAQRAAAERKNLLHESPQARHIERLRDRRERVEAHAKTLGTREDIEFEIGVIASVLEPSTVQTLPDDQRALIMSLRNEQKDLVAMLRHHVAALDRGEDVTHGNKDQIQRAMLQVLRAARRHAVYRVSPRIVRRAMRLSAMLRVPKVVLYQLAPPHLRVALYAASLVRNLAKTLTQDRSRSR